MAQKFPFPVTLPPWATGGNEKCKGCGRYSSVIFKEDFGTCPFDGKIRQTKTRSTRWRCDHCGSYKTSEDVVLK